MTKLTLVLSIDSPYKAAAIAASIGKSPEDCALTAPEFVTSMIGCGLIEVHIEEMRSYDYYSVRRADTEVQP